MKGPLVAVVLLLLLTHPLVRMADKDVLVLRVPVLYLYFFLSWALLIAAVAWSRSRKKETGGE